MIPDQMVGNLEDISHTGRYRHIRHIYTGTRNSKYQVDNSMRQGIHFSLFLILEKRWLKSQKTRGNGTEVCSEIKVFENPLDSAQTPCISLNKDQKFSMLFEV